MKKSFLLFFVVLSLLGCKKEMPESTIYLGYFTHIVNGEKETIVTAEITISQPSEDVLMINSTALPVDKNDNVSGRVSIAGVPSIFNLQGKIKRSVFGKYSIKGDFDFTICCGGLGNPNPSATTTIGTFVIKKS